MYGLQRSAQTFRRSGSSGLVWDERFLTECGAGRPDPKLRHSRSVGGVSVPQVQSRGGEAGGGHDEDDDMMKRRLELQLARPPKQKDQRQKQRRQQEVVAPAVRNRKAFRTRDVAPAAEPPSPRVPAGCCAPCAILRGSAAAAGGGSSSLARRARTKR